VRGLLRDFTNPAAAEALIWSAIGPDADDGGALVLAVLAGALESHAPRAALANLRWTQAKACERFGQVLAAESLLRQAFDVDSDHIAVLNDLARYASDRGDTTAGLAYLRRAGQDADEELVEVLERYQAAAHRDLGSKEPCWCGSGRRYKRCHLGKETAPLVLRVDWLHHKIGRFLSDGPWHEEIYEVAQARAQFWDRPDAFRAALTDPLVADTVLSEGGALDQFLMDRGVLLPADELLLAQQWALIERSVYEVEAVRPGQGFEARDLRTGERQVVQERSASRQLKVGDLICARLLPCVDSVQVFGGIEPVALYQRTGLMELLDSEPDPVELVDFLSARYAPPTLQNTEGEPLMFCQATLHIPDPAAMAARLDEAYESDESSEGEWVENVQTHGATRVRAFLRLSGDELSIETNSESRLDRVLDTVIGLQPQAQVVSESRTPFGQLPETDDDDLDDDTSAGLLDQQDPAVQQLLAQVVRECEVKWLDQSIPALSGATPREAAADPTRRQDVIRLIDSFPSAAGPGAMDPERLRADLGLV